MPENTAIENTAIENTAIPAPAPTRQDGVPVALRGAPDESMAPLDGECLRCYLLRMLTDHGCDGTHRWTTRWRDERAPRATKLLRNLARRGGCCCDCEVVLNVWREYAEDEENLPCARVPAGFTEPCRQPMTPERLHVLR